MSTIGWSKAMNLRSVGGRPLSSIPQQWFRVVKKIINTFFSVFIIKMILKHPNRGLIKPKIYISKKNCKILKLYNNEKKN